MTERLRARLPTTAEAAPSPPVSRKVPVSQGHQLHLTRYRAEGTPILLLPGLARDHRVFTEASGGALAPALQAAGFDAFVADFRGKGASLPRVTRRAGWGVEAVIREEIPQLDRAVARDNPRPRFWLAQGWSGLLALRSLQAAPASREVVRGLILLDTPLRERLPWPPWRARLAAACVRWLGYCPSRRLGLGPACESRRTWEDWRRWCETGCLPDAPEEPVEEGLAGIPWPPVLHVVREERARVDGVRALMAAMGPHDGRLWRLDAAGYAACLGWVDDPEDAMASRATLLDWLRQHDPAAGARGGGNLP
jgi:predicted alpha/beta hydrolase